MAPKADGAAPLPRFGRVKNNLKMGLVGLPNVGRCCLLLLFLASSGCREALLGCYSVLMALAFPYLPWFYISTPVDWPG